MVKPINSRLKELEYKKVCQLIDKTNVWLEQKYSNNTDLNQQNYLDFKKTNLLKIRLENSFLYNIKLYITNPCLT